MTSDLRRQLILGAAKRCFARNGFAGTTTRSVAAAAAISEGLLFKHFPSKAALYAEILAEECEADPDFANLLGQEPSTGTLVELIKGGGPEWPRLERDDAYVVVGSARPLEDAWRASQVGMIAWLGELFGLDRLDAYQLLTQISRSPLANVVDANYSAVTLVEKALLPPAQAYRGMHDHLRSVAKGLL